MDLDKHSDTFQRNYYDVTVLARIDLLLGFCNPKHKYVTLHCIIAVPTAIPPALVPFDA